MAIVVPVNKIEEILENLAAKQTKAVFLATSTVGQDGKYWCSDCEAVKQLYPIIEKQAATAGLPYYMFVVDRQFWKNQENILRKSKYTLLKSVPTLGLFDGKKLIRKLVENELLDNSQRQLIYE